MDTDMKRVLDFANDERKRNMNKESENGNTGHVEYR